MPGTSGLDVAEQILREDPDQPIVLFSAELDRSIKEQAARLGVRACLSKEDYSKIPEAIWEHWR
jgi:DNA-binding NarL/FixJ family response regulator